MGGNVPHSMAFHISVNRCPYPFIFIYRDTALIEQLATIKAATIAAKVAFILEIGHFCGYKSERLWN